MNLCFGREEQKQRERGENDDAVDGSDDDEQDERIS